MCKNNPKAILAGLALCFFGIQSSQAASILVTPSSSSIDVGDTITLTLSGESFAGFAAGTDGSNGGGIDISWDPNVLTLTDLANVDRSLFPGDSFFGQDGTLTAGKLVDLSVASLGGTTLAAFDIATLTFTAKGAGSTAIDLELGSLNVGKDVWTDSSGINDVMPTFVDGSVTVTGGTTPPPAVPVPPALLLFGSGLIGLGSIARKKKNTRS